MASHVSEPPPLQARWRCDLMSSGFCGWLVCECGACWCNMPPELQQFYRQWPKPPRERPHCSKCWACGRPVTEGRNKRCYEGKGHQRPGA